MRKIKKISRGQALRLRSGQVNIEITFSFIIIIMLLLSMIKVFFWVGNDLAGRRRAHEDTLTGDVPLNANSSTDRSYKQIRPVFYEGTPLDATSINSDIFGDHRLQ